MLNKIYICFLNFEKHHIEYIKTKMNALKFCANLNGNASTFNKIKKILIDHNRNRIQSMKKKELEKMSYIPLSDKCKLSIRRELIYCKFPLMTLYIILFMVTYIFFF